MALALEEAATPGIRQFDAVVPRAACEDLVRRIEALAVRAGAGPHLEFLYREDLGPDDRAAVLAVLQPCLGLLAPSGVVPSSRYFIETIALSRLGPGAAIPRHADNAAPDETGEWVPNAFRQRHLSAVLYLDGEHEGGELHFDRQQVTVHPAVGRLVVFPSDASHPHQVRPVRRGWRHALPFWLTRSRWHALLAEAVPVA